MVSVQTFTLTGEFLSPKDSTPGRGFIDLTPNQTVTDGAGDVVVVGVKVRVALDTDGAFSVVLPSGIGYHGRPVLYDGYPPEADFTVPLDTVTLDWADITNEALSPLDPTGLQQANQYTDDLRDDLIDPDTDLIRPELLPAGSSGGTDGGTW